MNILSESELTLEAKVENIPKFTEFVDAKLEEINFPMKSMMQVDIALDEILSNISYYAYQNDNDIAKESVELDDEAPEIGKATLKLITASDPQCIQVKFVDSGTPYNPLEKEDPDVTLSAEDRAIGGLGIFMTKQFADELTYQREGVKNVLTFQKNY